MCCFAEEISRSALAKTIISVEQVVPTVGRTTNAMNRGSVEQRYAAQRSGSRVASKIFRKEKRTEARAQTHAGPNANESFNELVFFVERDRGHRK